MALRVAVYHIGMHHRRSSLICESVAAGIARTGDEPIRLLEGDYSGPIAEVAVFYGMVGNLPKILKDYRENGLKAVYIDLGYWGRHEGGRWAGYHKFAVNSRHPTEYFNAKPHDPRRAAALKVRAQPWARTSGKLEHILLAGMGAKAAEAEGIGAEEWERRTIDEIRRYTDRPIVYRPKPSWKEAKPIEGTIYRPHPESLTRALRGCHAVVTHHSNVAVEALVAGVPAFCWGGVAHPMALQDLSKIETPIRPEGREQWIANVAWTQFSIAEIRKGVAWRHLKDDGLVP